jgi:prepilin-type N-terminal cleavage/methylation domain-containing protein
MTWLGLSYKTQEHEQMRSNITRPKAFSLVELVVVIVIIGIIAAMAIPRLSRGAAGAGDAALAGNLAMIRNALNLYAAEHNNVFPNTDEATIILQLTTYSSGAGATNATKTSTYKYGPYLVAIPPCPVGNPTDATGILYDATNSPPTVDGTNGEGWVYNPDTGEFLANTTAPDEFGKAYNTY